MVRRARDALYQGNVHEALRCLDAFHDGHGYDMSEEAVIGKAKELRRGLYQSNLEKSVNRIYEDWKAGKYNGNRDAMAYALDQEATVSHYDEAQDILIFSEASNLDVGALDWRYGVPWCELAFYALRDEICLDLEKEYGIDVNDLPPSAPVEMCQSCGEWRKKRGWNKKQDCCRYCAQTYGDGATGAGSAKV